THVQLHKSRERGRFSSRRKTTTVLRLLRGEDLELVSRELGVTATSQESQVCVFVAVDPCTSECVGIHAARSGNRFEALEPIRQPAPGRSSRSVKASANTLAASSEGSPKGWPSATTTAVLPCPTTSSRS